MLSSTLALSILLGVEVLSGTSLGEMGYRESMLGDLITTFQEYQRLYKDPDAPMELRRRAAFQAGTCAEKQGDLRRALAAYDWLRVNGPPGDPVTQRAGLRWKKLSAATGAPVEPIREELAALQKKVSAQVKDLLDRRLQALQAVDAEAKRQQALQETVERISKWLRRAGVEMGWPEEAVGGAQSLAEWIKRLNLDPRDEALLRSRLARRFFLEGLKALSSLELRRAEKCFQVQLVLQPEHVEAREFLTAVEKFLSLTEGLQKISQSRFAAELERRVMESEYETAVALKQAESQKAAGLQTMNPSVTAEAEKLAQLYLAVLREEDWAPDGLQAGGRLREFSSEAKRQLENLLQQPLTAEMQKSLSEGGRISQDLDRRLEELLLGWPLPWEWTPPRLEEPGTMLPSLKAEIEKTITLLEQRLRPPDPQKPETEADRKEAETRQLIEDTLTVLDWFPADLDPSQRYRRWLQSFLKK
ncbi:MAG: hypothetical protein HY717_07860 [Planctomycetes bacterium]|nr:hypothetical protein [Planctomycetota bacterium]